MFGSTTSLLPTSVEVNSYNRYSLTFFPTFLINLYSYIIQVKKQLLFLLGNSVSVSVDDECRDIHTSTMLTPTPTPLPFLGTQAARRGAAEPHSPVNSNPALGVCVGALLSQCETLGVQDLGAAGLAFDKLMVWLTENVRCGHPGRHANAI